MPSIAIIPRMKFTRLTVTAKAAPSKTGILRWECDCDCGAKRVVAGADLKRGHTLSCGCLAVEKTIALNKTHGRTKTATYKIWKHMKHRCSTTTGESYKLYGSRGIKVCDRWQTFENFLADMGERPFGKSIDRIDNNGDYEPQNCRWATGKEQMRNFRRNRLLTINGMTKPLIVWCEENGINYKHAKYKLRRLNWTQEAIIETLT